MMSKSSFSKAIRIEGGSSPLLILDWSFLFPCLEGNRFPTQAFFAFLNAVRQTCKILRIKDNAPIFDMVREQLRFLSSFVDDFVIEAIGRSYEELTNRFPNLLKSRFSFISALTRLFSFRSFVRDGLSPPSLAQEPKRSSC